MHLRREEDRQNERGDEDQRAQEAPVFHAGEDTTAFWRLPRRVW